MKTHARRHSLRTSQSVRYRKSTRTYSTSHRTTLTLYPNKRQKTENPRSIQATHIASHVEGRLLFFVVALQKDETPKVTASSGARVVHASAFGLIASTAARVAESSGQPAKARSPM